MKKITIFTIAFIVINASAGIPIKYPFTNALETVYINSGKHLLRIDINHMGEFVVEDGTEVIGEFAANGCGEITSLIIPDSVTNIMTFAFYSCRSLTNVVFGSGLREIGEMAFGNCYNLEHVELPDSLETLGEYAFMANKLKVMKIGSGLKNLKKSTITGKDLFSIATNLQFVTISPSNQWLQVENGKVERKKNGEGAIPRP